MICFRFRIPDVTEKIKRYTVGRTFASNLVYTIWAVFGGFILHFLLSSYLTVLLKPSYEEPVETAEDLIKRDITPFSWPGSDYYIEMFAEYPDPFYKQIAPRLHITSGWGEYDEWMYKVVPTGM